MPIPPDLVVRLSQDIQDRFTLGIKPKFDAYFRFTTARQQQCSRSAPNPHGLGYIYSNESMISDLTVLWSLFNDLYEAIGGPEKLANFVAADPYLQSQFYRIVEGSDPSRPDGSFWHYAPDGTGRVALQQAMQPDKLKLIFRTLRNGFAHFCWHYDNLSAEEYWHAQKWSITNADPAFDIANRHRSNYMAYIADGMNWDPQNFWRLRNLRILVTPYSILRYHLHSFLNYILNGSKDDVFQH